MTLCIAATCQESNIDQRIVFCADTKIGTWAASADIQLKVEFARSHWPVLYSGEVSRCHQMVAVFRDKLYGVDLELNNVQSTMAGAGRACREMLADEVVHKNLSVSYEYLKQNKAKFPPAAVARTYDEIGRIDAEAELIICGFVRSKPYIFVMDKDCSVSRHDHFAAIGTGAYIAEPALYQRSQNRQCSLARTIYHVYEAKRLGEIAEGVGPGTFLAAAKSVGRSELPFLFVGPAGLRFLSGQYEKYGLKSTERFRWPKKQKRFSPSAKEVNRLVNERVRHMEKSGEESKK